MKFVENIFRYIRFQWLRLLRIPLSPEAIARGMAIGVFIGLIPLLPSQSLIALGIALLLRASKVSAVIGTLISNPFNWIFLYALFYRIGKAVLPIDVPALSFSHFESGHIFESGWRIAAAMLAGGVILAVPCSIVAYAVTVKGVRLYRARKARRFAEKKG